MSQELNANDLLDCPWCGHHPVEDEYYFDAGAGDGHKCFRVSCCNKDCQVRPRVAKLGPPGYINAKAWNDFEQTNELAKIAARTSWNNRKA